MKTLTALITFRAHDSHIVDLLFTPDGSHLLTAGMDNLVHLWSAADWSQVSSLTGHQKSVNTLSLTPDGDRLVTASSDRTIREWDLASGQEIRQFEVKGSSASLSPQGRVLAVIDNPWLTLLKFEGEETIKRFKPLPKRTTTVSFSPVGDILAVGGQGDALMFFEMTDGSKIFTIPDAHEGYVLSTAFSSDGSKLASTGYEGRLRFWDVSTWDLLGEVTLENPGVQSLAHSPDGAVLAVASDHRVSLVDVQSMEIVQVIDLQPKGVYCLDFSPDGRWLACGAADKRVRVWDLKA